MNSKLRKARPGLAFSVLFAFTPVCVAVALTCVTPPSGLVSWWPGEGNYDDIVNGNTGTSAGAVTFVSGKVDQAFNFNGASNSYITLPNNPNMQPTSNQLTIDAWIKPDFTFANQFDTILTKRDGCSTAGISYNLNVAKGGSGLPVGEVHLTLSDTTGNAVTAGFGSTLLPNDGQFHHVAGTYDGSTIKSYLDGVLVGTAARSGPILVTTSAPVISHHGGGCGQRAVAAIDEIEFFDRALLASEIQGIFNAGSAGKCKGVPFADFTITKAQVQFRTLPSIQDSAQIFGRFTLGSLSDGVAPINEEVVIEAGTASVVIPAGSFVAVGSKFQFQGIISGVDVKMQIGETTPGVFEFKVWARGLNLTDTANPVKIQLRIGDDFGTGSVRLDGVLLSAG